METSKILPSLTRRSTRIVCSCCRHGGEKQRWNGDDDRNLFFCPYSVVNQQNGEPVRVGEDIGSLLMENHYRRLLSRRIAPGWFTKLALPSWISELLLLSKWIKNRLISKTTTSSWFRYQIYRKFLNQRVGWWLVAGGWRRGRNSLTDDNVKFKVFSSCERALLLLIIFLRRRKTFKEKIIIKNYVQPP